MARIELRDAVIRIEDGLSGTATIEEATPGASDTDCEINTVVLNTSDTDLVPVGARFTVNTANNTTVYTVAGRTGTNEIQTVNIDNAVDGGNFTLTFEAQETASIDWNAANTVVESALEGLSTIGANNVSVTGGLFNFEQSEFPFDVNDIFKRNPHILEIYQSLEDGQIVG